MESHSPQSYSPDGIFNLHPEPNYYNYYDVVNIPRTTGEWTMRAPLSAVVMIAPFWNVVMILTTLLLLLLEMRV
jgi:hypothetical protein